MNFMGFYVSKRVAEAEGLPPEDANPIALFGAIGPFTPLRILLVQTIARQQAPVPVAPATTGEGGNGGGGVT